jgi:5'-nucleotidase
MGDTVPFAAAEAWGAQVLSALIEQPLTPRTLTNVNFPALAPDAVRGVRVCRQGFHDYGRLRIVERVDPRGYPYFWFGLAPTEHTPGHITDVEAVADGFISVTPLHLDLTHESALAVLADTLAVILP